MYCPTDPNPADLLTRGIRAEEFTNSRLWDKGPDWLTNKNNYPIQPLATSTMLLTDVEEKDVGTSEILVTKTDSIHNLIDIDRFSRYRKLLRVTAYVMRFIQNCRPPTISDRTVKLSVKELKDAESVWLRSCQATTYGAESTCFKDGKRNLPLVRQLQLFHDDDSYIRSGGGRIHNTPLPEQTRFPFLLLANHQLTRFIIMDAHERLLHAGTSALITHMRRKFWVPSIRQCIQKIIRRCNTCHRVTGRPYAAPDPPPLPKM